MNEINKRYNIGMSIINNNQGVKAVGKIILVIGAILNKTIKPSIIIKSYKMYNRLKSIINKVFENVGYFFIGYKVDIELNQSDILEAKAKIRILRNTQSHNIDDIIELKKEVEALKDVLSNNVNLEDTAMSIKRVNNDDNNINLTNERGQDGAK